MTTALKASKSQAAKTVVIVGGTGHFGGRIARRLIGDPLARLVITSRNADSAATLVTELQAAHPQADVHSASLDLSSPSFHSDLGALLPDIVIHTAGPYQGQDYRAAEACIACGSHYIDLADGRDFVAGFSSLNEEAERGGILLVSGASTLPGISSAVIDKFRDRFAEIHGIEMSIAPAHQTPRGTGTIAAVISYCGQAFPVLVDGEWTTMHGWQNLRRQRYPTLGRRISGACDVPDLSLLPRYVEEARTVTFHAALEAPWEQLTLWVMGAITRIGLVRDWTRFISVFRWFNQRLIGLGSDKGGMHIRLSGLGSDGADLSLDWQLTARKNHGPEIPCTPALILTRKLLRDDISLRGAHPCLGLISLDDFDGEVSDLAIEWAVANTA